MLPAYTQWQIWIAFTAGGSANSSSSHTVNIRIFAPLLLFIIFRFVKAVRTVSRNETAYISHYVSRRKIGYWKLFVDTQDCPAPGTAKMKMIVAVISCAAVTAQSVICFAVVARNFMDFTVVAKSL
jgi:hypothetical protein